MDGIDLSQVVVPVNFDQPSSTVRIVAGAVERMRAGQLPRAGGRITHAELIQRVQHAMSLDLPSFLHCINDNQEWAIVGGGPSINDCVRQIRALKRRGVPIVSVNKSHDWLLEHGIVPWGHVLLDPKEWVADYVKTPRKDVRYFLASQCHAEVFKRFKGTPAFLWHAGQDFDDGQEPDTWLRANTTKTWMTIPGKTTVGLRAPLLGHQMPTGTDRFHMFGMDSSRRQGKLHGYEKPEAADGSSGSVILTYKGNRYFFDTHEHMRRQFEDFGAMLDEMPQAWAKGTLRRSFRMRFYGSGLLPFYAATMGLHADEARNADPLSVGGFYKTEPELDLSDFADFAKSVAISGNSLNALAVESGVRRA